LVHKLVVKNLSLNFDKCRITKKQRRVDDSSAKQAIS